MIWQAENSRNFSLAPYLIFIFTVPLGEVPIFPGIPWLTLTKLGFLFLLAYLCRAVMSGWRPVRDPRLYYILAVFLGTALLSALLSRDPGTSLVSFLRLAALAALGVITFWLVAEKKERLSPIFTALLVAGALLSLLGIYQSLTGKTLGTLGFYSSFDRLIEIFQPTGQTGVSVFRASATFNHPNIFGTFLIAIIPFALAANPVSGPGRAPAVLRLLSTLLCTVALVLTFSRSAWLGLAAAIAVLVFLRAVSARTLMILCAGTLLAIAMLPENTRTILWNRSSSAQSYDSGRIYSYRTAATMIGRHPALGVGPGMFHSSYKEYAAPNEVYRQNKKHRMDAHNTFLDLAAEGGLLTLVPFLCLLAMACISLARFISRDLATGASATPERNYAVALLASLAAIAVQSMFQSLEYEEILWILMGAAISFTSTSKCSGN